MEVAYAQIPEIWLGKLQDEGDEAARLLSACKSYGVFYILLGKDFYGRREATRSLFSSESTSSVCQSKKIIGYRILLVIS